MHRILAVAKREYMARLRTKTFLVGTIMTPLLMVAWIAAPEYFASRARAHDVLVLDQSGDPGLFALKEDGTLEGPEEGVEVARASEHALALQSPGRTLRVATQLVFEYAAPRLIAQPITRADADVCDP